MLDTHVHFWQFDPVRDAWIDDSMSVIRRDFLPSDLVGEMTANGVTGCVVVQADQSEAETDFLLQLAENHVFVKKVVGWADLVSPAIAERLAYFSHYEKLAGFRHIVQGEADVNFLLRKDFCRGIAGLAPHGFTFDILVFPHQLGAVLEFVRKFPNQQFVLDHLAKPYIKAGYFDGWAALVREIAKHENVCCKLSGMVTEADWQAWKYEDFVPYLDLVTAAFGTRRLIFGSDWPVCLLGGSYGEVLGIVQRFFQDFSPAEQAAIFAGNGKNFYTVT
jgi:L-fuconolactonase